MFEWALSHGCGALMLTPITLTQIDSDEGLIYLIDLVVDNLF